MRNERKPFGFLICGMVIGLALGIIYAKRLHAVEGMIAGPLLGAFAGMLLERFTAPRH